MRNKGDSPVITAIGRVFLFVQYLNDRVLSQLWYRLLLPVSEDDTVERHEKTGARPHLYYQVPSPSRWPSVSVQVRFFRALVVHPGHGRFGVAAGYIRLRGRALVMSC